MGLRREDSPKVPWHLTAALDTPARQRLLAAGVPAEAIDPLDLRLVTGPAVDAWRARGNDLYLAADMPLSAGVLSALLDDGCTDALVCLGSDVTAAAYVFARGQAPTIFIGAQCHFPHAEIHCADGARLIVEGFATATWHVTLDARNGGTIRASRDQLWASDVIVSTDDMHRIEDAGTGARINAFGGVITLGPHVWLGRDVMIFGGADIGRDCVVGARSLVRNRSFPAGCVIAGTPARVVGEGITWTREDTP